MLAQEAVICGPKSSLADAERGGGRLRQPSFDLPQDVTLLTLCTVDRG